MNQQFSGVSRHRVVQLTLIDYINICIVQNNVINKGLPRIETNLVIESIHCPGVTY